jgi:sec-independent protein translocase protein TatC
VGDGEDGQLMSSRTKEAKQPKEPKKPKHAKKRKSPKIASPADTMSLTDHLRELRQRIVKSILAVFIGLIVVFAAYDPVIKFLGKPFKELCAIQKNGASKYHCTGEFLLIDPLGGLGARMRVSGWGGILLALPVILWQIWQFVMPALHKKEKRYAFPFIASSLILFGMGAAIAYLTLEKALEFLVDWAGGGQTAGFTADKYLNLITLMMLAFGIGFLFPVLLVFLEIIKVVTPKQLLGFWRQAIVIIVVVAAIITPSGDPYSLFALSIPMWVFYFAAIGIGYLITRKKKAEVPVATEA